MEAGGVVTKLRTCIGCKTPKPPTDFYNKGRNRPNDYQSYCKDCMHEQSAAWNKTHTEWKNAWDRAWRKKNPGRNSQRFRAQLELVEKYLHQHPCVDCKTAEIGRLDFDHVRGVKLCGVRRMLYLNYPIEELLAEIGKCEVRCKRCHRKRHDRERALRRANKR